MKSSRLDLGHVHVPIGFLLRDSRSRNDRISPVFSRSKMLSANENGSAEWAGIFSAIHRCCSSVWYYAKQAKIISFMHTGEDKWCKEGSTWVVDTPGNVGYLLSQPRKLRKSLFFWGAHVGCKKGLRLQDLVRAFWAWRPDCSSENQGDHTEIRETVWNCDRTTARRRYLQRAWIVQKKSSGELFGPALVLMGCETSKNKTQTQMGPLSDQMAGRRIQDNSDRFRTRASSCSERIAAPVARDWCLSPWEIHSNRRKQNKHQKTLTMPEARVARHPYCYQCLPVSSLQDLSIL